MNIVGYDSYEKYNIETKKNKNLLKEECLYVCDCILEALDAIKIQKNTLLSPSERAVCSRS